MAKHSKIKAIAEARGVSVRELLISEYQERGSQTAVAEALEIAPSTVSQNLKFEGLKEFTVLVNRSAHTQEKAS